MPAETLLLVSALLSTTLVNYLLNSSLVPEDRRYLVAHVNNGSVCHYHPLLPYLPHYTAIGLC